jgi:hypothetical protein
MPTLNPWIIIAVIALLAGTNAVSYFKGYDEGDSDVRAEWNSAKNAATEKKLDVKAKQDVIKNAPIDVGVTTRRLRNASF